MKNSFLFALAFLFLLLPFAFSSCDSDENFTTVPVRSHNITVNWFKDATTSDPTAFIDFYRGEALTMKRVADQNSANAVSAPLNAQFIDAFCFEQNSPQGTSKEVSFINMASFANDDYSASDTFNAVVGKLALQVYTTSGFSISTLTASDFTGIQSNDDIDYQFSHNLFNGGYPKMAITMGDLANPSLVYKFTCSKNGKRGFFIVKSFNSTSCTMTLSVKVEE